MKSRITLINTEEANFKSYSEPNKTHLVNFKKGQCSCMGYTMRSVRDKQYKCRHIKEVEELLGL